MKIDYLLDIGNEQVFVERASKYITDDIVDQLITRRK